MSTSIYNLTELPPEARRLVTLLREHLPELQLQYKVRSLGVFGSYVRNEQTPASDLDVLVEYVETLGLVRHVSLKHHLEDLLGIEVDLTMKATLKPAIGKNILDEVVPV